MSKKNVLFIIIAFVLLIALFAFSIYLLLHGNTKPNVEIKEPVKPDYGFSDELTVPDETVNQQINDIGKGGFDSQTTYWIEKLRTVCNVEEELNKGKTIELLCQKYFPDEYRAYNAALLLGDDSLPEYPEDKVDELYAKYITLATNHNFYGIIRDIENQMLTYKFTKPHNYKIGDIYSDAMIMQDILLMSPSARVKAIGNLKTPEITLIAAISAAEREKCCMVVDKDSVCLLPNTKILIQSSERYRLDFNPTNVDEKLMNMYFNTDPKGLEVVKFTFTLDFSNLHPKDFGTYFEKAKVIDIEDVSIRILDENGNILYYLGSFTKDELLSFKQEHPEYEVQVNAELNRRADLEKPNNTTQNPSTETETESNSNNVSGMYSPDVEEPVEEVEYDWEKFEKFKSTVYEAYLPQYKLAKVTLNRIYAIRQITNKEILGNTTIQAFRNLNQQSQNLLTFIYNNQWSNLQPMTEADLAEIIKGEGCD